MGRLTNIEEREQRKNQAAQAQPVQQSAPTQQVPVSQPIQQLGQPNQVANPLPTVSQPIQQLGQANQAVNTQPTVSQPLQNMGQNVIDQTAQQTKAQLASQLQQPKKENEPGIDGTSLQPSTIKASDPSNVEVKKVNPIVGMDVDEAINSGMTASEYWKLQENAIKNGDRGNFTTEEIIKRLKTEDSLYETPEEKAKRERIENAQRAITGVSDLISNIANLSFNAKGAEGNAIANTYKPMDDRMRAIQEKRDELTRKYDTILSNTRLGEIAYKRKYEEAKEAREAKQAYNLKLKEIDNMFKMGQITYEQKVKLESALELENQKAANKAAEKEKDRDNKVKVANIRAKGYEAEKDKDYTYVYGTDDKEIKIPNNKIEGISQMIYEDIKSKEYEDNPDAKVLESLISKGKLTKGDVIGYVMRNAGKYPDLSKKIERLVDSKEGGENKGSESTDIDWV